jgi:hypothetical protein
MIVYDNFFSTIIQSPATENNLYLLPFFTGQRFPSVTPDKIHKSFYPDVSISNLILNIRSKNLLKQANITTIGQLLLTPYGQLLKYRNCGIHTVKFLQTELKKYILDKEIDYSSHWKDMESMLDSVIELKDRNLLIFKYRLGIKLPKALTLEECGKKYDITREAVRQIMSHIEKLILHPETEFKLRPFWTTLDKLLKKREVWLSEDLAKKIKEKLHWEKRPEPHALENFIAIKREKYLVTNYRLVGFADSKCLACSRVDGFLPEIMKDKTELPYSAACSLFLKKFGSICPKINTFPQKVIDSLVKLHLRRHLSHYKQFQMRNNKIINIFTYVPKKRRRR